MLKNKYVQIAIGAVVIIIAVIFVGNDFYGGSVASPEDVDVKTETINTESLGGNVTIEGSGDYEIKQVPVDDTGQGLLHPDLDHALVFPDSFPEDARVIIRNNVSTLVAQLETDPTSFEGWINLATQYKIIEDYEATRDVLEFLSVVSPENGVSFHNLGDLYHFNLKDFPKAEENFRKAIENSPQNTQSYGGLHGLYKYSYKQDSDLAESVLLEGIEAVTNNIDLVIALANYYKERGDVSKGDIANAKKYYEQARDEAEKLGNTQLVDTLNEEINNL